jgi:hypothetical protein
VPTAIGTAKNAAGIVCADGHRRHIAIGTGHMVVGIGSAVGTAIGRRS